LDTREHIGESKDNVEADKDLSVQRQLNSTKRAASAVFDSVGNFLIVLVIVSLVQKVHIHLLNKLNLQHMSELTCH